MDASCIPYAETGFFSPTIIDYLNDHPALKAFYNQRPTVEGFANQIHQKQFSGNRDVLANVLSDQYRHISQKGYTVDSAVLQNIESLRLNNTFTVTTGHQLNIFTGPFYFLFKIATAIKLASQLKATHPDKNFVPVYWMASEDHDFAEINHTNIGGKKIEWAYDATGATGRLVTKTMRQALNQYKGILGLNGFGADLADIVETAYTKFDKLADATRYLANALFAEYGLVIIDADDARLKKIFAPVMEQDIIGKQSYQHITETNTQLQKLGVHIQVNPREINFFYLLDNLRERIVFEDNLYKVLNTDIQFTEASLKLEINQHPERFSPNVVMRPLYQEVILPNLAYIGGGAEIVYWLELKANFDFYRVDFPILILRNSGLVAGKNDAAKLLKTGLTFADFFKPIDKIKTNWVKNNSEHQLNLTQQYQELSTIFESIKVTASTIDSTLGASTEAVQARLKHALANLERKMLSAEKRNYSTRLNHIEQVKNALFPGGGLQERNENFGLFYVQWGKGLIAELIEKFEPLDFKFTVLVGQ
jgi:bacillithiol biosynthesis cysteine-adding enzyme BshC